mgnify:CR=1 FL=1
MVKPKPRGGQEDEVVAVVDLPILAVINGSLYRMLLVASALYKLILHMGPELSGRVRSSLVCDEGWVKDVLSSLSADDVEEVEVSDPDEVIAVYSCIVNAFERAGLGDVVRVINESMPQIANFNFSMK